MAYAATFDVQQPERFEKPHVIIRVLIIVIMALLAGSIGWFLGAVYLIFPVIAAILISQKGAEQFLAESESNLTKWLRYVVAAYAYMGFLTDRLPNQDPADAGPGAPAHHLRYSQCLRTGDHQHRVHRSVAGRRHQHPDQRDLPGVGVQLHSGLHALERTAAGLHGVAGRRVPAVLVRER